MDIGDPSCEPYASHGTQSGTPHMMGPRAPPVQLGQAVANVDKECVDIKPMLLKPPTRPLPFVLVEQRGEPREEHMGFDAELQAMRFPQRREPVRCVRPTKQPRGSAYSPVIPDHLAETRRVVSELALQSVGTGDHQPCELCRWISKLELTLHEAPRIAHFLTIWALGLEWVETRGHRPPKGLASAHHRAATTGEMCSRTRRTRRVGGS